MPGLALASDHKPPVLTLQTSRSFEKGANERSNAFFRVQATHHENVGVILEPETGSERAMIDDVCVRRNVDPKWNDDAARKIERGFDKTLLLGCRVVNRGGMSKLIPGGQ